MGAGAYCYLLGDIDLKIGAEFNDQFSDFVSKVFSSS